MLLHQCCHNLMGAFPLRGGYLHLPVLDLILDRYTDWAPRVHSTLCCYSVSIKTFQEANPFYSEYDFPRNNKI